MRLQAVIRGRRRRFAHLGNHFPCSPKVAGLE